MIAMQKYVEIFAEEYPVLGIANAQCEQTLHATNQQRVGYQYYSNVCTFYF